MPSSATIYVKATAGMRLLNTTQGEPILAAVTTFLQNTSNCPFSFGSVEIIGGEEGAFCRRSCHHLL